MRRTLLSTVFIVIAVMAKAQVASWLIPPALSSLPGIAGFKDSISHFLWISNLEAA